MHCNDPACVSACPVAALDKLPNGPVVYDDERCIGCRYCMMACPFQIPKFQWSSAVPLIRKCDFCADRIAIGLAPACSTVCPTETLLFGDREALLKEAHRRIGAHPGKYYPEVYGEKIVGGTAKLYLTAVSFEDLGLDHRGLPHRPGEHALRDLRPGMDVQGALGGPGRGRPGRGPPLYQPAPGRSPGPEISGRQGGVSHGRKD